ncbi:hypothetical protein [Amycolatopsis albispora]|uniref:GerMN domain-containing protein n=1 Tax=Amycolatopsis albispora TaxID=1804986 RepID=A0A344LCK8_9PSEU|nr:hypothetical protein [Amycolatopsis albispora]AXB45782.1 hypothetical protein A4R43_27590 [Amycolatopsis albispora]
MRRVLGAVLLLCLLTACGVRPTDGPIPAGPGPAFPASNRAEMTLYFLLDDRIYPISRSTPGLASPESVLTALVRGPNAEEQKRGLSTHIPTGGKVAFTGQLAVSLPVPLEQVPETAFDQLSCTTVATGLWGALRVTGTNGSRDLFGCPAG